MRSSFRCIRCGRRYQPGTTLRCGCGGLLEVEHEFPSVDRAFFDGRIGSPSHIYGSGVWRFKEIVYPDLEESHIVTRPEGNTGLYLRRPLAEYVGVRRLALKHEGENPTGSFKDRGMTVGVSEALRLGASVVACASTGNTSSSLAAYAAQAGLNCLVFIPEGKIAYGKLAQTLAYGARVLQIRGNFDDAMRIVQQASDVMGF
ncbi:MAG: pyridoxal-phosphate dependent enzyme, partial [Candidatus Bathyarchaeia archaeon]